MSKPPDSLNWHHTYEEPLQRAAQQGRTLRETEAKRASGLIIRLEHWPTHWHLPDENHELGACIHIEENPERSREILIIHELQINRNYSGGPVTYRAGRDISRLTEMVRRAGFPFEARALGSPTRDGPVTRAAGDPALLF